MSISHTVDITFWMIQNDIPKAISRKNQKIAFSDMVPFRFDQPNYVIAHLILFTIG